MTAPNTINLHGTWRLSCAARGIEVDYEVPGDVHSALIKAGVIPDPYIGKNELACRWVADEEWVASREFEWEGEGKWSLGVDYLDTVTEVFINGASVLKADNCFRTYHKDLNGALQIGPNTIEIHFFSNVLEAAKRQKAHPYYVPYAAQNCPIPDTNFIRKPACHAGWDWNLALMPFGAYGRIDLVRQEGVGLHCNEVYVNQLHGPDGKVELEITAYVHDCEEGKAFELVVSIGKQTKIVTHTPFSDWAPVEFTLTVDHPDLWWPIGMGKQSLHDLSIRCGDHIKSKRIGLCQIELVDEPDSAGRRFAFKINGLELFCRGANWIPADALPSRATPEHTQKLLKAAVDANMNMIRVWGGGYYEQDWFYDICDELGILVWQDFQFSCNLYPADEKFLREVKREVSDQRRRLHHHPCIALWCGDNELIGALTWFPESRANRDRYLAAYDRLNHTIEQAAKGGSTPVNNWWPSSPSPGVLDFGDAWHDDSKGDMHFWSVWHEGKDFEHYRDVKPRFCSEFGFQSFPSMRIIRKFIESEDDLNISSEVMQHHQRNQGGNARIAETMFRYFRFPEGFENFVYVSQVQHGLAMQTAVDYWRSLKPHCMGTLMWQLNDTWPVASWSGLDHDGGWKAMHHMARDFYAPVSVVAIPDKEKTHLKLMAINDLPDEAEILIQLEVVHMDGTRKALPAIKTNIPTDRAIEVGELKRDQIPDDAMLFWSFKSDHGDIRRHFAFQPYKYLKLRPPGITSKVSETKSALEISVTSKELALHIMFECDVTGHFSKNVFDLLPDETQLFTFTPDNPTDLMRAKDTLVIRDLYSSSH